MQNIYAFTVKKAPKQRGVRMESIGISENDAKLYLEQQLKKDGVRFELIQPAMSK